MQKIQTYLYPNRVTVIADLAAFTTEYKKVYARTIKIYGGLDNTVQFEVLNADQKRLDLSLYTNLRLNIMDYNNNAVLNYPVSATGTQGIATATILNSDLASLDLDLQSFKYTLTGQTVTGSNPVIFYVDTQFNAVGTMQLAGDLLPTTRAPRSFNDFTAEIDLNGYPIYHGSAIPAKFYEAVPTTLLDFAIHVENFVGSVWLDATTQDTIAVESWRNAGRPFGSWSTSTPYTGTIPYALAVPVGNYSYFRVSYKSTITMGTGAVFNLTKSGGIYTDITVVQGGTGYGIGGFIKVPGSQLGGVDGTNDAIVQIQGVNGYGSSYTISGVISASISSGTASAGTATYQVSGTNYSGIVDSVTVS
jgi:hypothetical protein